MKIYIKKHKRKKFYKFLIWEKRHVTITQKFLNRKVVCLANIQKSFRWSKSPITLLADRSAMNKYSSHAFCVPEKIGGNKNVIVLPKASVESSLINARVLSHTVTWQILHGVDYKIITHLQNRKNKNDHCLHTIFGTANSWRCLSVRLGVDTK